jgi:hypothetical protein
VPAADELEAERVPELVNTLRDSIAEFRYRWLGPPIGGPEPTLRGQWLALALAMLVVFACFYAIGHSTRSGALTVGPAPTTLEGAAQHAAVPVGLNGSSPIAGAVPVAIVAKPRPRAARRATPALPTVVSSVVAANATPRTPVDESTPVESPSRTSAPLSAQRTPSQSPSPSSGSQSTGGTHGPTGSRGGQGSPPAGESPAGGSFDSSE